MKNVFYSILFLSAFLIVGCTIYTEKQSEALSRTVIATKDSLEKARVDLADAYIQQASRIVKPPKKRIEINSIYKTVTTNSTVNTLASSNKKSPIYNTAKQRVVIIPEKYKNDTVVVVSSEEFNQLLKDKQVFEQLKKDTEHLQESKKLVDEELIRQMEYKDKMIRDLNIMQKKLVEKDLAILQRNVIIVLLLATIGGATYLRIKGIL